MKAISTFLVSAFVLTAAASSRASDETKFEALVRKYVPQYTDQFSVFTPKVACICEPSAMKAAGVMLRDGDYVNCLVPNFANGKVASFTPCGSYVVLGK